ncbi:sialate O-acetylesterase [Chryseobacterium sp.]|uniref:sialate O-acetylesterase n=1 Tax=Chryseobacterium sp. TaxID=1871047 RepID=UPI0025C2D4E8|nr:sialate O-acetylesterase [Chryseobacterium sp.]
MKIYTFLSLLIGSLMWANINLPAIFTDNMVLQRNSEVVIWGNAIPKEEITLKADFLDKEYKVVTGNDAIFKIIIPVGKAGGPYTISLKGYNEVSLKNVMSGEVWLVSGQSNMEMSAAWGIKDGDAEVAKAHHPNIRFFSVPKLSSVFLQNNLFGEWQTCTPETMKNFSAIGYFFAEKLQQELNDVPVGIISAAWGGSPAELWTPGYVFKEKPQLFENYKNLSASDYYPSQLSGAYNAMIYPINSFKIKGVLWYQGETNTGNPDGYSVLLSSMISAWRNDRGYNFPFYLIQIAPYTGWGDTTVRIKNVQRIVSEEVPNSGLVITSDLDVVDDIHPKNKKPVGIRMANLILKNIYHSHNNLVESPRFKSVDFKGNKTILHFDYAEGLHFKNKESQLFEIAGTDGKFSKAKATIKGTDIILESKTVRHPALVRYAWRNTAIPDLFNRADLPASSFTTENEK